MNPLRTTVVMKTDISGSTARFHQLLAADLQALLSEHRDFLARHAAEHDGRIMKGAGDGYWLEFPSVTGAAKAAIVGLTQTLSLELASIGATANIISPGGRTRMSATMPGAAAAIEPDERSEDEFDPKDPSLSSPVVAWLASPEAGHISGQVIRALGEDLQLLKGWHPVTTVSNGQKRWEADKLGMIMATDVFGTRNTGLRLGS